MKERTLIVALVVLATALITATSQAAPSCCDPTNSSATTGLFSSPRPTSGPVPAGLPQRQVSSPKYAATNAPAFPGRGIAQNNQYVARPAGLPNAPAAPSCCPVPNSRGPQRVINPAVQAQSSGCGCCGGNRGQVSNSLFRPVPGQVQFTSNPPASGRQVVPAGQASCCSPTGANNQQGSWSATQAGGFPGLW